MRVTYQDGTRYRQANDGGTLVRDPRKVSGHERKRRRKLTRRKLRRA